MHLQGAISQDSNRLALVEQARKRLYPKRAVMESGGEDWPSAYCHTPMHPHDARMCIACYWHCSRQQAVFPFGLALAVTSFNRYSRVTEMIARRFCLAAASFYFDDCAIQDFKAARGRAQPVFGHPVCC